MSRVEAANFIVSELQITKYYSGAKYTNYYPKDLGLSSAEEPMFYDKAMCLDLCFEKEWNKNRPDCPWRKPSMSQEVFPEGWQGNATTPERSNCKEVFTADGRHTPMPATMPCQIEFPACFTSVPAEKVKNDISTKCLVLCKRSNYEESFSLGFDILDEEAITLSGFRTSRLANKTGLRAELRL